MKPIRERITEYSKGDNLDLFWRLFRLRERSNHRLATDFLTLVLSRMARRHGGYVGKTAVVEGVLSLPHGLHGVYISRYARIGAGCRIYQNVTIGEVQGKAPQIGKNCLIGAGAVVVGDIRIGDGVKIGAGPWSTPMCRQIPPSWRHRPVSYEGSDSHGRTPGLD